MSPSLKSLLSRHGLSNVKVSVGFAEAEITFDEPDRDAAWDMYVEMLTRITTQPLPNDVGDEETALASVYSLFGITREILRHRGRSTVAFSKVAIPVLNQVVRPFTAKWHRKATMGAFDDAKECIEFRCELKVLQRDLRNYNRMLADIAGVEDLTSLEPEGGEG